MKKLHQHTPYAIRLLRRPQNRHKLYWNVVIAPRMSRSRLSEDRIMRFGNATNKRVSLLQIKPSLWRHCERYSLKGYRKAFTYLFLDSHFGLKK